VAGKFILRPERGRGVAQPERHRAVSPADLVRSSLPGSSQDADTRGIPRLKLATARRRVG
jgi:hypothetical protein